MGIDLSSKLENPNLSENICGPELNIAGLNIGIFQIEDIIAVNPGYIKKDSKLQLKLNTTLLEDGLYKFKAQTSYLFNNGITVEPFYIVAISEDSGNTVIEIYGKTLTLIKFFGTLEVKALSGVSVKFSEPMQVSQIRNCKALNLSATGITSNSVRLSASDLPATYKALIFRIRPIGGIWTSVQIIDGGVTMTGLEANTKYEVCYCKECSSGEYSFNSDFITIKTS